MKTQNVIKGYQGGIGGSKKVQNSCTRRFEVIGSSAVLFVLKRIQLLEKKLFRFP